MRCGRAPCCASERHTSLASGHVAFSGTDEVIVVHRTCDEGGSTVACLVANVTDKPVRVEWTWERGLRRGMSGLDGWQRALQDLEAHEVRLFVSDVGDRILGSDFEPFGLGGSSSFMTSSRLLSSPLCGPSCRCFGRPLLGMPSATKRLQPAVQRGGLVNDAVFDCGFSCFLSSDINACLKGASRGASRNERGMRRVFCRPKHVRLQQLFLRLRSGLKPTARHASPKTAKPISRCVRALWTWTKTANPPFATATIRTARSILVRLARRQAWTTIATAFARKARRRAPWTSTATWP